MSDSKATAENLEQVFSTMNENLTKLIESSTLTFMSGPVIVIDSNSVTDDFPRGSPYLMTDLRAVFHIFMIPPQDTELGREPVFTAYRQTIEQYDLPMNWLTWDDGERFQNPDALNEFCQHWESRGEEVFYGKKIYVCTADFFKPVVESELGSTSSGGSRESEGSES